MSSALDVVKAAVIVVAAYYGGPQGAALAATVINGLDRALAPKPKRPNDPIRGEVPLNYAQTDAPIPFVYGTVRAGGMDTLPGFTSGDSGEYLHRVITHSIGRIDDIGDCYIDDEFLVSSAMTATVTSGYKTYYTVASHSAQSSKANINYVGNLDLQKSLGTNSHGASLLLSGAFGAHFLNFRGNGLASSEIRYKLNSDRSNYTSLPQTTFVIRGLWCYDPRKDSTVSGGSGSHRFNDSTTWEHTSCPPLCLAHFLTHQLAGGYAQDEISWQTVMTAADTCDALVNVPGGTQKRYTCNGTVYAPLKPEDFIDTIKTLAASMLGYVIFTNGVWEIYAGTWKTPTWTIDRKDPVSLPKIKLEGGSRNRYNRVLGWFNSSSRSYQRNPIIRSNSTYMVADGGIVPKDIDLTMCTNEYEAIRRSEFLLRQSRNQIMVTEDLPPRFSDVGMLETGTMVDSYKGWTSKTFRLVSNIINTDGRQTGTFKEEQSTDWTDPSTIDYTSQLSSQQLPTVNALVPLPTQRSYLSRLTPDPLFERSTANGSYWLTGYTTVFSRDGTLLNVAVNSQSAAASARAIYSIPDTPITWSAGMQVGVSARLRLTSTMSWDTSVASIYNVMISPVAWTGVSSPNLQELGGGGNCRIFCNSAWQLDIRDVASLTSTWRDYDNVLVMDISSHGTPSNFAHPNSYPYLVFKVEVPQIPNGRAGAFQLDHLRVY